jgi:hypothetical protein
MNVFVIRRNSGFGGAERVAERIARRFEALHPTSCASPGTSTD